MNEMSRVKGGAATLKKDTCSTCPKKVRLPDGKLECHAMPPTLTPILAMGTDGKPTVIGEVNSFPKPNADWFCWQHPALQMRHAMGRMFEDAAVGSA